MVIDSGACFKGGWNLIFNLDIMIMLVIALSEHWLIIHHYTLLAFWRIITAYITAILIFKGSSNESFDKAYIRF